MKNQIKSLQIELGNTESMYEKKLNSAENTNKVLLRMQTELNSKYAN